VFESAFFVFFDVVGIAVVTSLAGSGNRAFADGVGTQASFNLPYSVAVDASGNVFVADANNHRIRVIFPTGGTFCLFLLSFCVGMLVCLYVCACV
jgi:hypothetical protein